MSRLLDGVTPFLHEMLAEGASLVPSLDAGGGLVRNRCGELANVAVGSYQRSGASSKTPVVNPPLVRWGYVSITKTLVGVVMQMLMANESLPHISWSLPLEKNSRFTYFLCGDNDINDGQTTSKKHIPCLQSQAILVDFPNKKTSKE